VEFVASIDEAGGVLVDLIVRAHGKTYEILSGHRRHAAAVQLGLETVPCRLVEMTDEQALIFLAMENLQRANLSPVDEAEFCIAFERELGMDGPAVARALSRSEEWVRTRQLVLELGDEVRERVCLPAGDPLHVTLGAVAVIGGVPDELRPQAVEMVLHPEIHEQALNARQAKDILRACLVEPWRRAKEWEARQDAVTKEARAALTEAGHTRETMLLFVTMSAAEKVVRSRCRPFDAAVPADVLTADAPADLTWGALAHRHGLPVMILPDPGLDYALVVDTHTIWEGEKARAEHRDAPWIAPAGKSQPTPTNDDDDEDDREAPAETVIEQTVESYAQVRLSEVRRLGRLAMVYENAKEDIEVPDWVPRWAEIAFREGRAADVSDVCEWVLGLRA
jgi:ParB/RepB/Spo0J family partition protein